MKIFRVKMRAADGMPFDVYVETSSFQVAQQKAEAMYPDAKTYGIAIDEYAAKLITG